MSHPRSAPPGATRAGARKPGAASLRYRGPSRKSIFERMKTITQDSGSVTWTIDPLHTTVGFGVRHLMITNVHGVFERVSGSVRYDAAAPEASEIQVEI